jgi:hypothetical protein
MLPIMLLSQFFPTLSAFPPLGARFWSFNGAMEEMRMDASAKTRTRLIVADFLGTLFVTFCIGVTTAIALGACVVLMAGEAHGAEKRLPPATVELVMAHYLAARHVGLFAVERVVPSPD